MKYFLVVLLLNIGFSSCTSLSSKLPWLTEKSLEIARGYPQRADSMSPRIHRRQSNDNDSLEIPNECFSELTRLSCQTGLSEQAVRVGLNCGFNDDAESIAASCDTNAEGMLCGVYDFSDTLLVPAQDDCLRSPEPLGDSCPSMECANSLEAVRNSPPGCCVDAVYNITNSPADNRILDYSLWSQCGVETFEQCERTISRTPIPNVTPCTDDEYFRQLLTLQCSSREINTILDQVEEMEQCSQIRRSFVTLCQVNSRGENCNFLFNDTALDIALNVCSVGQTSCTDGCRTTLETFRNDQGCCFNLFYNDTEAGISANVLSEDEMFIAGYALWNQCGIETPPLSCRSLLDDTDSMETEEMVTLMTSRAPPQDLAITTFVFGHSLAFLAMWNN